VADVNGRSADSEDVTVAESPATDGNVSGDDASATLKGTLSTDGNEAPAEIDSALDANGGSADNQNDSESVDLEEENKEATKDDKELWSEAAAKDSMSEDEGVSNADIFDQGNNKVMDYSQDKSNESVDQNDSEWDDEEEKYNEEEEENENFSSGGSAENRDADDSQDNVDNTGWNSPFNGQSETQGVNEPTWDSNAATNPGLGGGSGEFKYGVGDNAAATPLANTNTNIPDWDAEESDGFPMGLLIAALTLIIFYVYRKKTQSQVATRDCTSRGLYQPVRHTESKRN